MVHTGRIWTCGETTVEMVLRYRRFLQVEASGLRPQGTYGPAITWWTCGEYFPSSTPTPKTHGRASGGFSDGIATKILSKWHNFVCPSNPRYPYETYADDAMSPEPGSNEGCAGAGVGQHSGRSEDGKMSLLEGEEYGGQSRGC